MKINTKAQTRRIQNSQVKVSHYFYDANQNPLKDEDGYYNCPNGQIAVSTEFSSSNYEYTTFNNLPVIFPINQFHLPRGRHLLKMKTNFWEMKNGNYILLDDRCCEQFTIDID